MKRLLPAVLVLAACTGGSAAEPTTTTAVSTTTSTTSTTPTTTTTTTSTVPGVPAPLNGTPVADRLDRRVLAVKIDNHWEARPQSGLQEADAVFETLVEAGLTRFLALFHHSDSAYLGPVRSGRPTDSTLARHLGATLAISGAQDWVIRAIASQGVPILGEGPGMFRVRGRRAPHNLYADTSALREAADRRGHPDQPPPTHLFTWGELDRPWQHRHASRISLDWSSNYANHWVWDGSRYLRFHGATPHLWMAADGSTGQVTADTVVVLFARRYVASGSSGSAVPAMSTVGEGRALVFARGTVREGSWRRESIEEPFLLSDESGDLLTISPGSPWICIFPDDRQVTWTVG